MFPGTEPDVQVSSVHPAGVGGSAPVVIIGGGPAGLTAAYELSGAGLNSLVLEASDVVGGISRTVEYKGYRFDIGGHRFFTKVELVEKIWRDVLGDDFLPRGRSSRILYHGHYYDYPLDAWNVYQGLGPIETVRCAVSYAHAILFPTLPEIDFGTYVRNRFGRRLFNIFFKTYTEKVWGIPCHEIQAEWAAQRIKGLSITQVLLTLTNLRRVRGKQDVIKTLIREFDYPRHGPGMMWTRTKEIVEARGSRVVMNAPVSRIFWEPGRVTTVEGGGVRYDGSHFVSSMPIRELVHSLVPSPPAEVVAAGDALAYRDFLTVALIVRGQPQTIDNWIYIHDTNVDVGRIQIFNNWGPEMVPDPETTCFGMEYFCFEGDGLWTATDAELLEKATREIERLGIAKSADVIDGAVVRQSKAYPVYDEKYRAALDIVRGFVAELANLQLIGRNGMHKYNNQDHSMLTGVLAARNIMGADYDLWGVNVDDEYQEEGGTVTEADLARLAATHPLVPERIAA